MKTANRKAVRYQGSLVFCNSAAKALPEAEQI